MSPTLKQDDFIVVPKLAYGLHLPFIERPVVSWRAPSRGEVVVVNRADDPSTLEDEGSQTVVKRVVGISGDRIAIVGDRVKVNGESLVEDYAVWGGGVARARRLSFVVPEGSVFLMGDNRDESDDSRNWRQPFIPISRVIGPVGVVYWSKGGFAPPARVARY
jgi:signal peptidase I